MHPMRLYSGALVSFGLLSKICLRRSGLSLPAIMPHNVVIQSVAAKGRSNATSFDVVYSFARGVWALNTLPWRRRYAMTAALMLVGLE